VPVRLRRVTSGPFGSITVVVHPLESGPRDPAGSDAPGGQIQEVRVSGDGLKQSSISGLHGSVRRLGDPPLRFTRLPPGQYLVAFEAPTLIGARLSAPQLVSVESDRATLVEIRPRPDAVASLRCEIVTGDGRPYSGPATLGLRATHIPERARRWDYVQWPGPPYIAVGLAPRADVEVKLVAPVLEDSVRSVDLSRGGAVGLRLVLPPTDR